MAGLLGTFGYLVQLGRAYGGAAADADQRVALHAAMAAIHAYERDLTGPLLEGLGSVPGLTIHGIRDPARVSERLPTVAVSLRGHSPATVVQHLADSGINAWHGTMYTPDLMRALSLDEVGGVVRIGLLHYNATGEIERLVASLSVLGARSTAGITLSDRD